MTCTQPDTPTRTQDEQARAAAASMFQRHPSIRLTTLDEISLLDGEDDNITVSIQVYQDCSGPKFQVHLHREWTCDSDEDWEYDYEDEEDFYAENGYYPGEGDTDSQETTLYRGASLRLAVLAANTTLDDSRLARGFHGSRSAFSAEELIGRLCNDAQASGPAETPAVSAEVTDELPFWPTPYSVSGTMDPENTFYARIDAIEHFVGRVTLTLRPWPRRSSTGAMVFASGERHQINVSSNDLVDMLGLDGAFALRPGKPFALHRRDGLSGRVDVRVAFDRAQFFTPGF